MDISHKEQSPHQGLPDEGIALPSRGPKPEGGSAPTESLPESMPMKARSKAPATPSTTHEDDPEILLRDVRRKASLLVHDPNVRPDDRLVILRKLDAAQALKLTNGDLERYLAEAQAEKDGRPQIRTQSEKLSRKPTRWLIEDILIKDGTNLVYAEPKCGKTRFLLGCLGALVRGDTEYLGKKVFDKGEKIFICGPDMTEPLWAEFLHDYGLAEPDGTPHERIAGVTAAGMNFRLDPHGIDMVEEEARNNPGLIVLIDSFASCMWGMNADENKSNIVDPLLQLMNAVAAFKATLIVVHHAKKATEGAGVSASARGSSAITAVVDQIVAMRPVRHPGTEDETGEVAIQTRGRASKPEALAVRQGDDGLSWESLGSPEERATARKVAHTGDKLTAQQKEVMLLLCRSYATNKTPMTVTDLCRRMGMDPKQARRGVTSCLDGLIDNKGFAKRAGSLKENRFKAQHLFLPTEEGRQWFDQETAKYPDP